MDMCLAGVDEQVLLRRLELQHHLCLSLQQSDMARVSAWHTRMAGGSSVTVMSSRCYRGECREGKGDIEDQQSTYVCIYTHEDKHTYPCEGQVARHPVPVVLAVREKAAKPS
jgi:hypothetical protein